MTILWIYNMPLRPEAGGTERITSLVAKGLSMLGHKCMDILVFNQKGDITYQENPVSDVYQFLNENKVDIVINQIAYSKWLLADFLSKGGCRWHMEGGKIISCLHFDPKPASFFHYLKNKRDKNIVDYISIIKSLVFYPYYQLKSYRETGEIFNWIYDNSDFFVTLSPSHFKFFKKVTRRNEYNKLRAINNPLTFEDISTADIISEKENIILICSRMDEYQKRVSLALKAWKKIQHKPEARNWRIKIVGTGEDLENYKKYAEHHNLQRISFEGLQNPEPYYRKSDILLMTSYGIEGWGLTLTESLQRGVVPVVMNTSSVYSDIITHCYNGFLSEKSNLDSFIHCMESLMADKQRLRSMQLNALASSERFTLDRTMKKWQELI